MLSVLCVVALASFLQSPTKPALPAAEAVKLRTQLAEAFADPDGKSRDKLINAAKALEAKYDFDSLLATLRSGPLVASGDFKPRTIGKSKETLTKFGTTTVGFLFASGGQTYRYALDLPPKYDPKKPSPLFVDPGHGSGAKMDDKGKADFIPYYRSGVDDAGIDDCIVARTEIVEQIGADGLRGARPEEEIAEVFDDFFRDVASRVSVDPDRVFVGGISQTGFWAWYLARARPDRFAGVAPIAAVTWQVDKYLDCFEGVHLHVVHGDDDKTCPVAQPRKTTAALKTLGFPVEYDEVAGGGHNGMTFGRLSSALETLAKNHREPFRKIAQRSLLTTKNPWCRWIRVDKITKEGDGRAVSPPVAQIAAKVDGQRIEITSKGVEKVRLSLARELVDLSKPVEVVWNEKSVHSAIVARSFASAVTDALDRGDAKAAGEAVLELRAP